MDDLKKFAKELEKLCEKYGVTITSVCDMELGIPVASACINDDLISIDFCCGNYGEEVKE